MGYHNMCLLWDNDANFIFESWHTQSDGGLVLGIFLSFFVSLFSVGFSFVKDKILSGSRIKVTIAYVINYLIKIIIMGLIMTMNAWVCGAVIFGMTFGQMGFQYLSRVKNWKKINLNQQTSSPQLVQ